MRKHGGTMMMTTGIVRGTGAVHGMAGTARITGAMVIHMVAMGVIPMEVMAVTHTEATRKLVTPTLMERLALQHQLNQRQQTNRPRQHRRTSIRPIRAIMDTNLCCSQATG